MAASVSRRGHPLILVPVLMLVLVLGGVSWGAPQETPAEAGAKPAPREGPAKPGAAGEAGKRSAPAAGSQPAGASPTAATPPSTGAKALRIPARPSGRVLDLAHYLTGEEEAEVEERLAAIARQASSDPRLLVLPSLETSGWPGSADSFARAVFVEWALDRTEPGAGDFAENGLLLILTLAERRIAFEPGRRWSHRERSRSKVLRVFDTGLDLESKPAALEPGFEALATFVRTGQVRVPGDRWIGIGFGLLFFVLLATAVSYSRSGADSSFLRVWLGLFCGLGAILTFLLRRSVDFTARLASSDGELDRDRVVVGQW